MTSNDAPADAIAPGPQTEPGRVLLGTSGWTYDSWTGPFYPPGTRDRDRLELYAARYPTVELNASFYRWPRDASFTGWAQRLPAGFEMAVKAPKALTHEARMHDPDGEWAQIIGRCMGLLGDVAGPLLVQLAASHRRDDAALGALLASLRRTLPGRVPVAVELRHPSWYDDDVFATLAENDAAYVIMSGPGLPRVLRATSDVAYVRWHGHDPKRMFHGSYPDDELGRWAQVIRGNAAAGRRVYGYFNNDMSGRALANLDTLRGLVGSTA